MALLSLELLHAGGNRHNVWPWGLVCHDAAASINIINVICFRRNVCDILKLHKVVIVRMRSAVICVTFAIE